MTISIGCGSSCGACRLDETVKLAESGLVKYLCFDRQAERGTPQLWLRKTEGRIAYDEELEEYLRTLLPIREEKGIKLITNGGGEDPEGALECALKVARELGLKRTRIACTTTEDLLQTVLQLNPIVSETGRPLSELDGEIVGATAYHTGRQIVDALDAGVDVIITGRVGDSTLYLMPMIYEFGWSWTDWDRLGKGMGIGHMLECGPQVTGGYFASPGYKSVPNLARVGLPYVEVEPNGDGVITKLPTSGGLVTVPVCKEQMLYEVGDPSRYIHNDVVVDFTTSTLEQVGPDRVRISGTSGHPRPDTLKVLITVKEGFIGESYIQFGGSDAYDRAKFAAELVQDRLEVKGILPREFRTAYIGVDSLFAPWAENPVVPREVMLHVAGRFSTREEAEWFMWDCFMGAGNHYGPAAGTPGRNMMPVDDTPTVYTVLVPRELVPEPKLLMMETVR